MRSTSAATSRGGRTVTDGDVGGERVVGDDRRRAGAREGAGEVAAALGRGGGVGAGEAVGGQRGADGHGVAPERAGVGGGGVVEGRERPPARGVVAEGGVDLVAEDEGAHERGREVRAHRVEQGAVGGDQPRVVEGEGGEARRAVVERGVDRGGERQVERGAAGAVEGAGDVDEAELPAGRRLELRPAEGERGDAHPGGDGGVEGAGIVAVGGRGDVEADRARAAPDDGRRGRRRVGGGAGAGRGGEGAQRREAGGQGAAREARHQPAAARVARPSPVTRITRQSSSMRAPSAW